MTTEREAIALAERVELWQERMAALGLGHWRILRVSVVDETPGGPHSNATVQPSFRYNTCKFWFKHEFIDNANPAEVDETIIHEWLHVLWRDFDQAVESIETQLAPAVSSVWEDRVEHEREGLIDICAQYIYSLHEEVVP